MSLRKNSRLVMRKMTFSAGLLLALFVAGLVFALTPGPAKAQDRYDRFGIPDAYSRTGRTTSGQYPLSAEQIRERLEREKREAEKQKEEEEAEKEKPEPLPCDRKEPSSIEKAYRIQYSDVIIRQLRELEHLDTYPEEEEKDLEGGERRIDRDRIRGRSTRLEPAYVSPGVEDEEKKRLYDKSLNAPRTPDEIKRQILLAPRRARQETHPDVSGERVFGDEVPSMGREREPSMEREREPSETLHWLVERYFTQFGYDLFIPEAFQPPAKVVPPKDYLLGPGDALRVNLWGSGADAQFEGEIKPNGTITLPKLGVIPVAGVPYGQVERVIGREARKYVQGVNISVTLVKPKSLEVYVLGQACMPGLRVVPAFSTVLTALCKAGGPLKTGSLRNIKVFREGKLLKELDLYDLILKGDTSNDVLLRDKDVVHVPYIGPTVAVVGAVLSPGIFEMKDSPLQVGQALEVAGGSLSQAQARLNIRRFKNNKTLTVLDVSLYDAALSGASVLDGDLVEVRYIGRRFPPTIKVTGHVWDTMEYEYHEGMRLSEIMPSPEMLRPDAITDFVLLYRYNFDKAEYRVDRVPLKAVWAGKYDTDLDPHDEIRVLSKKDFGIKRKVYLRGGVWQPGDYDYTAGLTLRSLIALGGGVKDGAKLTSVELSRQRIVDSEIVTDHKVVDLTQPGVNVELSPFDTVRVPVLKDAGVVRQVSIEGEVRFPGDYTLKEGERVSDLIERAGGFLPTAYFYGTQYYSENAQEIQQKSIDMMIQDLELRLIGTSIQAAETAVDVEEVKAAQAMRGAQEAFIKRLRSIRARGRVTIKMADLATFRGSSHDFEMEKGDRLVVPKKPNFVSVVGSVYSPSSYLYQPNLTLGDYLDMAGGPTKTADDSYIYVFKANGEVISKKQSGSFLIPGFYSMKLMPGDSIVVPEDLERVPYLRLVKNITDIVFKIASTAGITVAILDRD